ncbi:hypothetical protein, partial [Bacillus altitudinis]|uniref:hypothetical protein n=1 Tax=Bacillus altitudinis TaxID=293387 RepID=UPI001F1B7858
SWDEEFLSLIDGEVDMFECWLWVSGIVESEMLELNDGFVDLCVRGWLMMFVWIECGFCLLFSDKGE